MYLPSVQPASQPDVYINGDVQIDSQAILASGVILQAGPHSRIVIKAGACLGMGTIINAYQGTIEIGTGTVLGAGVLIIGNCQIGSSSCIGSASTIINTSVESMTMIPPGSLLGDRSRQAVESPPIQPESEVPESEVPESEVPEDLPETSTPETVATNNYEQVPEQNSQTQPEKSGVIGEVYINQLLLTLFPGGKNLRKTQENGK